MSSSELNDKYEKPSDTIDKTESKEENLTQNEMRKKVDTLKV